jgi:hypothetical protein
MGRFTGTRASLGRACESQIMSESIKGVILAVAIGLTLAWLLVEGLAK